MNTLAMLTLILIVSRIFEEISERCKSPALLGDILAGFLLGPAVLNLVHTNGTLEFLGLIGVIFIMVLAGIEVNLKKAEKISFSAAVIAIFAVAVPMSMGIATALLFKMNIIEAAIIGISLSITASAIVAEILEELKAITTKVGETLIVAGIFDDIIGLISITVLLYSVEKASPNASIFSYFTNIAIFFIISAFIGYYIFPKLMEHTDKMKSPQAKFSVALILILTFVAFADTVGMSAIIGAFIAGLAINHYMNRKDKTGFEKDIKAMSEGFMTPIFFVLLGASINIAGFHNNTLFFIAIITVAFTGKLLGGAIGAYITKYNSGECLAIGSGMATRGAVTLVVVHIAHRLANENPILVPNIELICSTIIASVFFVNLINIPLLRFSINNTKKREQQKDIKTLKRHINNQTQE